MKIWRFTSLLENEELSVYNKDNSKFFEKGFKGLPMLDFWEPIKMITSKDGEKTDILSLNGKSIPPIFTQKAIDKIGELIEGKIEILPLFHDTHDCYAINVTNVLACIDYENSEPNEYGGFEKFAFIEGELENQHIFRTTSKINPFGDKPIISIQTFVSDEFKQRVEESGLKGFDFDLIWSSDGETHQKRSREINPSLRITSTEDLESHIQQYYGPIKNHYNGVTNKITDVELYQISPTRKVPFNTMVTMGNSYFRMMTPASVDSGYAEIVMHLPKKWKITEASFDHPTYGWTLRLLREFGNDVMRSGYWLGQWLVFPNQSNEDLRQTYSALLGGEPFDPSTPMKPYDKSTEFCGVMVVPPLPQSADVFKMKYTDNGKEAEGEWPIYFHTLLPLYREEIIHYFKEGRESLLERLMKNGIDKAFDLYRENTCK